RPVAVPHVLEEPQRAVLRACDQQTAVGRRERFERLCEQLRREVDAQQTRARIASTARRQHVAGIERNEDLVLELERGVAVDAQRIAAIPRGMNRWYAGERLRRGTPRGHPVDLGALRCMRAVNANDRTHRLTLNGSGIALQLFALNGRAVSLDDTREQW